MSSDTEGREADQVSALVEEVARVVFGLAEVPVPWPLL